jgi:hypothetical protein
MDLQMALIRLAKNSWLDLAPPDNFANKGSKTLCFVTELFCSVTGGEPSNLLNPLY